MAGHRTRNVGWIAGGALAAAVILTGCSGDTGSASDASDKEPAASSTAEAGAGSAGEGKQEDAAASQGSGVDRSTGEKAVATWVAAVVKGEPEEACLVMGEPAEGGAPAQVGSEAMCEGDGTKAKQMEQGIGRFRESFTPDPPTDNPKVEVAHVPASGGTAVFPADKITVDGQRLDKIILSNSTGLDAGELDVQLQSTKIEDEWYVTDVGFDIG
ncbi:hypothetical protein [Streptomyces sp. Ru87]|uniref:hypothetical protein n=1 Tax=Streptomyces sp. Ru87 TaxID=2044307 RepID=UPI000BF382E8|nr:hypothetical protein [Streptomyces sp. Ru87]PGH47905.1 hypothetical protein CRI70_26005 [Streptomyces sp. Ru87]